MNVQPIAPEFEEYRQAFLSKAEGLLSAKRIQACLEYAEPLLHKNIPVIYNLDHLQAMVGYKKSYIDGAIFRTRKYYRSFTIPKKRGGVRNIDEPLPGLKEIQSWVLEHILNRLYISPCAKGFVKGRSIRSNGLLHRRQNQLLTVDIKDFFPSITSSRVRGLFASVGYNEDVSFALTRLCTFKGCLAQGAPSSPAISNVIAWALDKRLFGLARKLGLRYSRYADDLSFSGRFTEGSLIKSVESILNEEGFDINEDKTRVRGQHQRQEVTGVLVNQKLNAARDIRRHLRQVNYYITRYGLSDHLSKIDEQRSGFIDHYLGLCSHVLHLNSGDRDAIELRQTLKGLVSTGA